MSKDVAFLIPTLSNGGAERVVSNITMNLSDKSIKIILYDSDQIFYPYKGEIIDLNLDQIDSKKTIFEKILIKTYKIYVSSKKLKQIKKQYNIKTTVSFLVDTNILNLISKSNGNTVISVRNFNSVSLSGVEGKIYTLLIKLFYNKADSIVAVSKAIRRDLIQNFNISPDKIQVIYNPYEISKIQEIMHEDIEKEYIDIFNSPVIINVARLIEQKGQRHLIKAFSRIKGDIGNAKLVFLGRGELENELKDLARKCGLKNDVFFLGYKQNPFKFIRNSSVFVLSSFNEGFPNTLVEAMACGIPVVSTDCRSGPREILAPDTDVDYETDAIEFAQYGILTPVCNSDHTYIDKLSPQENMLADVIIKLLSDNELNKNYCQLAQQRAQNFDVENIIPQWEKIL